MPNRAAKARKEKKRDLNELYSRQGRTANQVRKYKAKLRAKGINPKNVGRRY
tara:strand:- start:588 stop:743 length:156 start_codon:yes stop_codon:yes gene_type:complete